MARHALKVVLMFTLLERQRLALNTLPGYIGGIPVFREYNRVYFQTSTFGASRSTSR